MLNSSTIGNAAARQPRGIVKITDSNGNSGYVDGWFSIEIDNNAYRSADTFRIVFVISQLPAAYSANWFSVQTVISVEIFAGFPSDPNNYGVNDLTSLLYGNVDDVTIDPVGGVIELSGRDLTALLIDTKTSEAFANNTSSQIAVILANRHGLTPVVTATTKIIGDYYAADHINTNTEKSEWEILSDLANIEGFMIFVKAKSLYFQSWPDSQSEPYVIQWQAPDSTTSTPQSNAVTLSFSRNLTISKGVTVEVHSWNTKQEKGFTESWPKTAKQVQAGQSAAKTQVYKKTVANLTPDSALDLAKKIYKQIILHEMKMDCYLPADLLLDCTKAIQVRGTNTAFDQTYYPENIRRTMSVSEGFRMNISAKNTSPIPEALA